MERRNFFKKMIGVIAKSTKETTPQFSNNKYEFGDPEDFEIDVFHPYYMPHRIIKKKQKNYETQKLL